MQLYEYVLIDTFGILYYIKKDRQRQPTSIVTHSLRVRIKETEPRSVRTLGSQRKNPKLFK